MPRSPPRRPWRRRLFLPWRMRRPPRRLSPTRSESTPSPRNRPRRRRTTRTKRSPSPRTSPSTPSSSTPFHPISARNSSPPIGRSPGSTDETRAPTPAPPPRVNSSPSTRPSSARSRRICRLRLSSSRAGRSPASCASAPRRTRGAPPKPRRRLPRGPPPPPPPRPRVSERRRREPPPKQPPPPRRRRRKREARRRAAWTTRPSSRRSPRSFDRRFSSPRTSPCSRRCPRRFRLRPGRSARDTRSRCGSFKTRVPPEPRRRRQPPTAWRTTTKPAGPPPPPSRGSSGPCSGSRARGRWAAAVEGAGANGRGPGAKPPRTEPRRRRSSRHPRWTVTRSSRWSGCFAWRRPLLRACSQRFFSTSRRTRRPAMRSSGCSSPTYEPRWRPTRAAPAIAARSTAGTCTSSAPSPTPPRGSSPNARWRRRCSSPGTALTSPGGSRRWR